MHAHMHTHSLYACSKLTLYTMLDAELLTLKYSGFGTFPSSVSLVVGISAYLSLKYVLHVKYVQDSGLSQQIRSS